MAVPPNSELARICASTEFATFVEKIKREYQVVISPNMKTSPPSPGHSPEPPMECSFKFRCQRSNSDFLVTAREFLEQFLMNHSIPIYPSVTMRTHKRGDSFADAFPHFDSKVLPTARTRHQSKCGVLICVSYAYSSNRLGRFGPTLRIHDRPTIEAS